MRRHLVQNGLALFFGALFLSTLTAQSLAGWQHSITDEKQHGHEGGAWWDYVRSTDFWGNVMENWQSEFLQFSLFIGATIWLVQKGSAESKRLEDAGRQGPKSQKIGRYADDRSPRLAQNAGAARWLYENSLLLVMTAIFFLTWFAQSLNNWRQHNQERLEHEQATISWPRYLLDPEFWERTLQNWQSEFLAIGVMVVFTIYLRQHSSPESKVVGAPHDETGTSG